MNLADYRRANRAAMARYSEAVAKAGEVLGNDLAKADEAFFEDNEAVKARSYPEPPPPFATEYPLPPLTRH